MIDCDKYKYPWPRKQIQDGGFLKQYMHTGLYYKLFIDNSSPIQYSSSSAVGMKDSNNAAPSKTVGNHHYAKSEQFLLITIVLFIGRLDWGKWRRRRGNGRRRCTTADRLESRSTASLSGFLKIDSEIYVSYISGGALDVCGTCLSFNYFLGENFGFVGPVVKERSS